MCGAQFSHFQLDLLKAFWFWGSYSESSVCFFETRKAAGMGRTCEGQVARTSVLCLNGEQTEARRPVKSPFNVTPTMSETYPVPVNPAPLDILNIESKKKARPSKLRL